MISREDEVELQWAIGEYKRRSGRQFPTWCEILEVLLSLGYAKRVWRPIEPDPAKDLGLKGLGDGFQPLGEVSSTGLHCWFSRVETPAGF